MDNKPELIVFDVGYVLIYLKRDPLEAISEKLDLNIDEVKMAHKKSTANKEFSLSKK